MRARTALLVSTVRCQIREVKLSAKPAEMIAASPKATVPVLVLPDGTVIDESIDIMRWALAQHDPEGWLDGDDAGLIAANDGAFKHDLDRYKYPDRHGADGAEHRASGLTWLMSIEERLVATPYLCRQGRSLTDAAIMPFVRQFVQIDRAWFDDQPLPAVRRWLAAQLGSSLFERTMIRRATWAEGDQAVHL